MAACLPGLSLFSRTRNALKQCWTASVTGCCFVCFVWGQFLGACTKQKPYIVITELMACSLADAFLKTFYAPTQRRQVEVALDFARGMAYLHSRRQPIVHR
jgi:hypothetical protein